MCPLTGAPRTALPAQKSAVSSAIFIAPAATRAHISSALRLVSSRPAAAAAAPSPLPPYVSFLDSILQSLHNLQTCFCGVLTQRQTHQTAALP